MKTFWFYFKDTDENGIYRTMHDGIDSNDEDDAQERLQNIYPSADSFQLDYLESEHSHGQVQ